MYCFAGLHGRTTIKGGDMPAMQTMLTDLNQRFGPEGIRAISTELLARDELRLSEVATAVGTFGPGLARYLDELPPAIHDAILGVIRSAVARSMPITFAWAPGYDHELSVWDVADTADTTGGITVLMRSRYPADTHPLERPTTAP
jgi:hypothetical protein